MSLPKSQSIDSPMGEKLTFIKDNLKKQNYFFITRTGGYSLQFPKRSFSVVYNPRFFNVEIQEHDENGYVKDRLLLDVKEAQGKLLGAANMYKAHGFENIPATKETVKVLTKEKRKEIQKSLLDHFLKEGK